MKQILNSPPKEEAVIDKLAEAIRPMKWFVLFGQLPNGQMEGFVEGRDDFLSLQDAAMSVLLKVSVKRIDEAECFERM